MGRILAIDYGNKRVGIAVTDPLQLIASPKETVRTHLLLEYLQTYCATEPVEAFVLGMPVNLDRSDTDTTAAVRGLSKKLQKLFPDIPVHWVDERFTSKLAHDAMLRSGMKKKDRQNKENVDKISAAIILQSYLDQQA